MTLDELLQPYKTTWWIHFEHIHGSWECFAEAGDSDCPYPKEYDPSDGHGYSSVEAENYRTIEECAVALIEKMKTVVPDKKLKD